MNLVLPIIVATSIAASTLNTGQTKLNTGQKIASGSGQVGFVVSDFVRDIQLGESKRNKNPNKSIPKVAAAESIKASLGKAGLGLQPVVIRVTVKPGETKQPASQLNSPAPSPTSTPSPSPTSAPTATPCPSPSPPPSPEDTSNQGSEDTNNQEDLDTIIRKFKEENVLGAFISFVNGGFGQLRNEQTRSGNPCNTLENNSETGSQMFEGSGTSGSEVAPGSGTGQGPVNAEPTNEAPTTNP